MDEAGFFRQHGWVALREVVDAARAEELARELDRVFPEGRLPAARVHERAGVSALSPLLAAQVRDAEVQLPEEAVEALQAKDGDRLHTIPFE